MSTATKVSVLMGVLSALFGCGGGGTAEASANIGNSPAGASAPIAAAADPEPQAIAKAQVVPKLPFVCQAGAITCVEVASAGTALQTSVPITFGQPFKAGAWKHQTSGLVARDQFNQVVPLQADDVSSHRDGSARFAVLNARIANLQVGERRVISLFAGGSANRPQSLAPNPSWGLDVVARIYSQQISRVRFGNRNGSVAGTPFLVGETIQMLLQMGTKTETYSVVVDTTMAGGGHEPLSKIAEAFLAKINASSTLFLAEKPGLTYENLYLRPRSAAGGSFTVSFRYAGLASISQTIESAYAAPADWQFKAQSSLAAAIAAANAGTADTRRRFHGPVASEFHLWAPLKHISTGTDHPFLTARLDVRLFDGGTRIKTDVVLENNWTFKANPRNITYELFIRQNGQTAHHQPAFTHYHHARWRQTVWNQSPLVVVRHQMRDFLDSRAVWNYDLGVAVPESVLSAEASALTARQTEQKALGPMGNVFLQPYFPATGGRPEIGPLPRWSALYLLTQDQRAWDSMMANSNAAAAVPIHHRDENTQQPLNTVEHTKLTTHINSVNLPVSPDPTIWNPDTAHQGSFAYLPYLLTGDRFWLDETMFWASWNVLSLPADYRALAKSLINRHQVRGQAWALRSIAEAHRSLPDAHPMKSYFSQVLQNNLDWYVDQYLTQRLGSPMGAIQSSATVTPPWMTDMVATVLALLAENADPGAQALLDWFARFTVGRFVADADGFCAARAPGYYWTNASATGVFFTNWSELFATNYPADVGKACNTLTITEGYPALGIGYAAYGRAMLAAAANARAPQALTAYQKWKSMTPKMDAAFQSDPTWAIAPR